MRALYVEFFLMEETLKGSYVMHSTGLGAFKAIYTGVAGMMEKLSSRVVRCGQVLSQMIKKEQLWRKIYY